MKNKKNKKRAIISFFLIINVFLLIWLVLDMTSKRTIDTGKFKQIAYLEFKTNDVKRKLSDSLIWDAIDKNDTIYFKDSVLTLDNSEAIVRFSSGEEIEVNPNSLVVLEKVQDSVFINFVKGDIFTKSSAKGLKIKFNDKEIDIKNARASISSKAISVLSGSIDIGDKKIKAGELAEITKEGIGKIEKNIFVIYKPQVNEKILLNKLNGAVEFNWKTSDDEGRKYQIQISKTSDFKNLVFKKEGIISGSVSTNLAEGIYYFRLLTIQGNSIRTSPHQKFTLIFEKPTKIISPLPNEIYKYNKTQASINFSWSASMFQDKFVIEISGENDFKNTLIKKEFYKDHAVLELSQGSYYFRVKSYNKFRSTPGFSAVRKFSVVKIEKLDSPEPISPAKEQLFFKKHKNPIDVLFSWNPVKDASGYNLIVARDEDFKTKIYEKTIKVNSHPYSMEQAGDFYWTVQAIDELGELSNIKQRNFFSINDKAPIKIFAPVKGNLFFAQNEDDKLEFKWANEGGVAFYKLIVREEKEGEVINETPQGVKDNYIIPLPVPGKYIWLLEAYNNKKRLINLSTHTEFVVRPYPFLDPPILLLPENNSNLEFFKDRILVFKWKEVKDAQKYLLFLSSVNTDKEPSTLQREVTVNQVNVPMPGLGIYQWNVQAVDKNNIKGKKDRARRFIVIKEQPLKAPEKYNIKIE